MQPTGSQYFYFNRHKTPYFMDFYLHISIQTTVWHSSCVLCCILLRMELDRHDQRPPINSKWQYVLGRWLVIENIHINWLTYCMINVVMKRPSSVYRMRPLIYVLLNCILSPRTIPGNRYELRELITSIIIIRILICIYISYIHRATENSEEESKKVLLWWIIL